MSRKSVVDNQWARSGCERILLIYSAGFHFEKAAQTIKRLFPEAELTAATPPSMEERARHCDAIDRVLLTELERYSPVRNAGTVIRHVRKLRRDRYDMAVVMFRSMKLGVLLYCMRAAVTAVADVAGGLHPWHVGPVRATISVPAAAIRRLSGLAVYYTIRTIVGVWNAFTCFACVGRRSKTQSAPRTRPPHR